LYILELFTEILNLMLKFNREITRKHSNTMSSDGRHCLARFYQKLQILIVLSNQCFQKFVWPNIQFTGAALMISMIYSLVLFGHSLNFKLVVFMAFMLCTAMTFVFLILDFGSRPLLVSKNVLSYWKRWNSDKLWRKIVRSCQPIVFRVGPFHKMDRERGPALIRFSLQRAFYLVVQTKTIRYE